MTKKKVLYVSSNGGIHDYRFLKKLSQDYDVIFLHYASASIIPEVQSIENLKIISKPPLLRPFPLLSEVNHFKRIVKEFKPDIIHTGYVWQVGILAAVTDVHPHLAMPWGSDILIEPNRSFIKKKLVAKVMHQCDHIQCDAEYVKNKIIKDYSVNSDKITVFPWGIELSLFSKQNKASCRSKLKIDENKFVLIFNRRMELLYGAGNLISAYSLFSKGKDDVLLLVLSDGSMRNKILKFITENNLENKVSLIGRVPNTELPLFLNSSDVYISPSLSDGSSLSLLEAMACGLGVIVSDVPSIREWINSENGIVTPINDINALAQAMELYYNSRELIATHGKINRQIASEKADWDINYKKLQAIYDRLLT